MLVVQKGHSALWRTYVYLFSEKSPYYTVLLLLGSIRLFDLWQIHPIRFLFGLYLLH